MRECQIMSVVKKQIILFTFLSSIISLHSIFYEFRETYKVTAKADSIYYININKYGLRNDDYTAPESIVTQIDREHILVKKKLLSFSRPTEVAHMTKRYIYFFNEPAMDFWTEPWEYMLHHIIVPVYFDFYVYDLKTEKMVNKYHIKGHHFNHIFSSDYIYIYAFDLGSFKVKLDEKAYPGMMKKIVEKEPEN